MKPQFEAKFVAKEVSRRCGGCTLCCKLLPMTPESKADVNVIALEMVDAGLLKFSELASMIDDPYKPAGKPCPYQRHGKGCSVYARRPFGCRFWNCRWLTEDDTAGMSRPDRAHYVIDAMPDVIRITYDDDKPARQMAVCVVWVDPNHPEAHRDPALRAFMQRRAEIDGMPTIVRFNERDALVIFPPAISDDGQWHERGDSKLMHREGHELDSSKWTERKTK